MNNNTNGIDQYIKPLLEKFRDRTAALKVALDENERLKKQLTNESKDSEEQGMFSRILRLGQLDLVNVLVGMDIDPKILIPIKPSDLGRDLLDTLNLIAISDMNKSSSDTHIVGSYRWRAHKYPGDIDMMEIYKISANSEQDVAMQIKSALQKVIGDIVNNTNVRMADLKSGFDTRFDNFVKNLGTLKRNYVVPDMIAFFETEIPGYNQAICGEEINKLERIGAINIDLRNKLLSLLPQMKMTGNSYFEIYKILRKERLLRWSTFEIQNGYKVKPSLNKNPPYFIRLEEAVLHDTPTKIDLWAKVRGRWTEITNFFVFKQVTNGTERDLGFKFDVSLDEAVKYDIMYYSSPAHEKNTKLAKRIWARSISHLSKCVQNNVVNYDCIDPTQLHIIKKLYPLFATDINKVSQIIADIELFDAALDKITILNLSYSFIFKDLLVALENAPQDLFRMQYLGKNINEMNLVSSNVKQEINNIIGIVTKGPGERDFRTLSDKQWDMLMTPDNVSRIKASLEKIQKLLRSKQEEYFKVYLISFKLYPDIKDSIVRFDYTPNYLNLPKINSL